MSPNPSYTPILKGKVNDLKALGKMPRQLAIETFPVIELLSPGDDETIDHSANRFASQLTKHCPGQACSVDLHSIAPDEQMKDGSLALETTFGMLSGMSVPFVPVFGFDHEPELWDRVATVAVQRSSGITFRLKIDDLEAADDTIAEVVDRIRSAGISSRRTSLLLDLGSLRAMDRTGLVSVREMAQDFVERAMSARNFRLISIVGSSMPKDVSEVEKEGVRAYRRRELPLWLNTAAALPDIELAFGDYGIVHPNFSDKIIPRHPNAKIRYTTSLNHQIFRGYSLREGEKYSQYRDLSNRVLASEFYLNRDYSYGDDYVWRCANREVGTGNLGTWVEVDTSHHLVLVAAQLPQLAARLSAGAEVDEALEGTA